MKNEFRKYLEDIGVKSEALMHRIEEVYDLFCLICPAEAKALFVDDLIDAEGTRQYTDITFFAESYHFSARRFLTDDDFILLPVGGDINCIIVEAKDYNFKEATLKSRLKVQAHKGDIVTAEFKASQENCHFLRNILLQHLIPNLKP